MSRVVTRPDISSSEVRPVPIPDPLGLEVRDVIRSFSRQMTYTVVKDEHTATLDDVYRAVAHSVRNRLAERWFRTQEAYYWLDLKRVYYLSLEFLVGRALLNNILNLGATGAFATAMEQLGYRLEDLQEQESDAALGNGGLGRLAACFLDSASTLGIPFYGYGIRYEYGMFRQEIVDGTQVEAPDHWLQLWSPWEVPRPNIVFPVGFYGHVQFDRRADGTHSACWTPDETIRAMAYDTMVIGYRNDIVNSLRLWAAKASNEFDLAHFNAGDYVRAVEQKNHSENISKVLYPADDNSAGKELRLKQQYFFVSATLQDILRRFLKAHDDWSELPDKAAIQLNDTHPAIAIPEMMRLLLDQHGLEWDEAWRLSERMFSFTNHTLLPEALETWSSDLLGRLLPRHLQIIEEIDRRTRASLRSRGVAESSIDRIAALDPDGGVVRMANLAIIGSHAVNGVAKLHSSLLRQNVFTAQYEAFPERFHNVTNGVTPRRWLLHANEPLASLITDAIGDGWAVRLEELRQLEPLAGDASFREEWLAVKRRNKVRLASWIDRRYALRIDSDSMLDSHVKRIHEYKRQLLALMHAIALYRRICAGEDITPRTLLFAGKASPCYYTAKAIIELIHAVGAMVDSDAVARQQLRIVFVPDYGVSHAEVIFPATELSEHISTAGFEASGTGNMKAILNGALIIGTLDGANLEIRERIGEENLFTFGLTAPDVAALRSGSVNPQPYIEADEELRGVIETIETISRDRNGGRFDGIVDALKYHDFYCCCADFRAYADAQQRAVSLYASPHEWARRSILNVSRCGYFSSDRAVAEYAAAIWHARSLTVAVEELAEPAMR